MIYLDNNTEQQTIYIPRNGVVADYRHSGGDLQTKNYRITENGRTLIIPDQGFIGISAGTIDVEVQGGDYDEGYADGYVSGETDGREEQKALLSSTALTENGVYSSENGWSGVTVDIPMTSEAGYEFTVNGDYILDPKDAGDYVGFEKVSVKVNVDMSSAYTSGYTEGYASGYTSGETDGYASGYTDGYSSGTTDGYASGYTSGSTDGYASGETVGYASGVTDGKDEQKALLSSTTLTGNGQTYTSENGWSGVTVSVPILNVNEMITDSGQYTFKASDYGDYAGIGEINLDVNVTGGTGVLTSTAITTNNSTTLPPQGYDGFNRVDVEIDTTPYYESGYTEGYASGYTSGESQGYSTGYASGYTSGSTDGYNSGKTEGYSSGYTSGYTDGYSSGYTSGYTEGDAAGYASGYTSGVTYQKSLLDSTTIRSNGNYTRENGWNSIIVDVPFTQILTQAQYNALSYKDPKIIYLING